jgi:hypothetical protein
MIGLTTSVLPTVAQVDDKTIVVVFTVVGVSGVVITAVIIIIVVIVIVVIANVIICVIALGGGIAIVAHDGADFDFDAHR